MAEKGNFDPKNENFAGPPTWPAASTVGSERFLLYIERKAYPMILYHNDVF